VPADDPVCIGGGRSLPYYVSSRAGNILQTLRDGFDMADHTVHPVADDTTATIDADTFCSQCGYNLRGLRSDGRCPECGLSIAESIRGDALCFADPDWLRKIELGTLVKLWSVLILVIMVGVAVALPRAPISPILVWLPPLLCGGGWIWSTYLITTPEPRLEKREDPVNLRRIVRISAILAMAGIVIEMIAAMMIREIAQVLDTAAAVLALAWVVQIFSEMIYYRRFAGRVPSPKLARTSTVILWGLPSTLLMGFFGVGLIAFTGPAPPGVPDRIVFQVLMIVSCTGMAFSILFMIAYVFLLDSFRQAFSAAIERRGPETTT
jgi:hypothetical protein